MVPEKRRRVLETGVATDPVVTKRPRTASTSSPASASDSSPAADAPDVVGKHAAEESMECMECVECESEETKGSRLRSMGVPARIEAGRRARTPNAKSLAVPALILAAQQGDPRHVRQLLSRGHDPRVPHGPRRLTAALVACAKGNTEIVEILISHGHREAFLDRRGPNAGNGDSPNGDSPNGASSSASSASSASSSLSGEGGRPAGGGSYPGVVAEVDTWSPLHAVVASGGVECAVAVVRGCPGALRDASQRLRGGWGPLALAVMKDDAGMVVALAREDPEAAVAVNDGGEHKIGKGVAAAAAAASSSSSSLTLPTIATFAARKGKLAVLKALLDASAVGESVASALRASRGPRGGNLLHVAARAGHVEMCAWLATVAGIDATERDASPVGLTPLHTAVRYGHPECVVAIARALPKDAIETAELGSAQRTALLTAVGIGHADTVRALIHDCGADPRKPDAFGWTPLLTACRFGRVEAISILVRALHAEQPQGTTTTSTTPIVDEVAPIVGWAPIHAAAAHGQVRALACLVNVHGASLSTRTVPHGSQAMHLAASMDADKTFASPAAVAAEVSTSSSSSSSSSSTINGGGRDGRHAVLRFLLSKPESAVQLVSLTASSGTPELIAAASGDAEALVILTEARQRLGVSHPPSPWQPLHCATAAGHTDAVAALLQRTGADPSARTAAGTSAFTMAVTRGNGRIVADMIAASGNRDTNRYPDGKERKLSETLDPGHNHQPPIFLAAARGDAVMVRLLASHGRADVCAREPVGMWTPLHAACRSGHPETVRLILDLWSRSRERIASAASGSENNNNPTVLKERRGWTPLMVCAVAGTAACAKAIMDWAAARDSHSRSLADAEDRPSRRPQVNLAERLLKDATRGGRTALSIAARCGHWDVVEAVLGHSVLDGASVVASSDGDLTSATATVQERDAATLRLITAMVSRPRRTVAIDGMILSEAAITALVTSVQPGCRICFGARSEYPAVRLASEVCARGDSVSLSVVAARPTVSNVTLAHTLSASPNALSFQIAYLDTEPANQDESSAISRAVSQREEEPKGKHHVKEQGKTHHQKVEDDEAKHGEKHSDNGQGKKTVFDSIRESLYAVAMGTRAVVPLTPQQRTALVTGNFAVRKGKCGPERNAVLPLEMVRRIAKGYSVAQGVKIPSFGPRHFSFRVAVDERLAR